MVHCLELLGAGSAPCSRWPSNRSACKAPVGDSDDTSFGDFIGDKAADNPMEEAGFSMLKDKIKDVLDTLTEREREVLEQRFGLKDGYSRTLEEVGRQFQVTRERTRKLRARSSR